MSDSKFKINFINSGYRRFYAKHRKNILGIIDKCYTNGDFVLRKDVEQFEKNIAKFTGTKHGIGVNSGTDALKIAYKALGLKNGDEVITVSHVFIAPIEEIIQLGGKAVLCDVKEDGLIDEDQIEKLITKKTVGIVPVHLSGKVCRMDKIMKIAKKHKLWVVEDACQALGAKLNGKPAGSWGNVGCFSHIAPKTLGVGGDAGSIVTNDKALATRISLMRNHWNITQGALHGHQPKQPKVMEWGYNSRLDNIHAAVLNYKIKFYPGMLNRRKAIATMYNRGFKGISDKISLPVQQNEQIYQEYIIRVPNMWDFKNYMAEKGIELLIRDVTPNHVLYRNYFPGVKLPITEAHAVSSVRLPTYPELKNDEVKTIIKAINDFYDDKKVIKVRTRKTGSRAHS